MPQIIHHAPLHPYGLLAVKEEGWKRPSGSIQAVSRALNLLVHLNSRPLLSIAELHRATGMPKPTIVRMLKTLIDEGYVVKDPREWGYRVTAKVRDLGRGFHGDPLVIEAGKPWAMDLTRRTGLPSAISMYDGDSMVVRFSTIRDSAVSPWTSNLNKRLSFFAHAQGRAYLSYCSAEERRAIMSMIGRHEESGGVVYSGDELSIQSMIRATRRVGYAEPDLNLKDIGRGSAIAVPIIVDDHAIATLALFYFRSVITRDEITASFVPMLQEAAANIALTVRDLQPDGPVAPHTKVKNA
jgi:IclR family mhp operon transcriptional activator